MDIDGTKVHYVEEGQGPALILIHGAGGSSREWTFSMMPKLTDRYRVIAVDRPGHGFTSRIENRANSAESMKEQADLIVKLAENLGVSNAIVAGQSYGGGVAMAMAVHHPEFLDALVMIAGVSNPWDGELDQWYKTTDTFFGKWFLVPAISILTTRDKAVETVNGIFAPNQAPDGYIDHMGIDVSTRPSQIRANSAQINRSFEDVTNQYKRYGEISVPTEIIHGDADTTVPLQVHSVPLSKQIEGANLTVLEGIGHMPQQVREADVIAAIDRAAKRAGLN